MAEIPRIFITQDQVDAALKLALADPDGSEANAQARQNAKSILLQVAQYFTDFGNLSPGSLAARHLFGYSNMLRREAAKIELLSKKGD